jgi:uncharacterized sporulation protein YeaH/YhbH (DUF444 family)
MAGNIHLIDRRLNGGNKSATNRQRFIRRYKSQLKRAVGDMVDKRSITDVASGGEVNLPARDISEPSFRHGPGGDRETVHPGNRQFSPGDTLARPKGGVGGEGGGGGGLIVAAAPPDEVVRLDTHTGRVLGPVLARA